MNPESRATLIRLRIMTGCSAGPSHSPQLVYGEWSLDPEHEARPLFPHRQLPQRGVRSA